MSERSVAEIIGWKVTPERKNDDGSTTMCSWCRPDAPLQRFFGRKPEPTVDDLLAWLTGQGYAVKPQTILPGNNITIEVWRGVNAVCQRTARTLLAALEAAVRAVAGES